uniref:Uncharacterized protein n=1 Tax=Cacopsylla melanoneura TaxID=428564 RepID=A0A8D9BNK6_9HEMI
MRVSENKRKVHIAGKPKEATPDTPRPPTQTPYPKPYPPKHFPAKSKKKRSSSTWQKNIPKNTTPNTKSGQVNGKCRVPPPSTCRIGSDIIHTWPYYKKAALEVKYYKLE